MSNQGFIMKTTSHVKAGMPLVTLPKRPAATYLTHDSARSTPNDLDVVLEAESSDARSVKTLPPPPYALHDHNVDEDQEVKETPTLARMLFFYGFLFFPFWLAGIYIIFSPLRPTVDWEAGKTPDEKAYLLQALRATELKWAKRCLYALMGFTVAVVMLVIIIKYSII